MCHHTLSDLYTVPVVRLSSHSTRLVAAWLSSPRDPRATTASAEAWRNRRRSILLPGHLHLDAIMSTLASTDSAPDRHFTASRVHPPLCCTSSCGCILNEAKQDESRGANDRSNVTCSASQGCTAGAPDELRFVATPARRTALAPGMKEMHPTELQSDSCDPSLGALDNTSTTQPHAYHARLGCILRS